MIMNQEMTDFFTDKPIFRGVNDKIRHTIKNPLKYGGNEDVIVCSTDKEKKFIEYLESMDLVIYWLYKPVKIEYENPYTKEKLYYIPDFQIISYVDDSKNLIEEYLVDINPQLQTEVLLLTYDEINTLDDYSKNIYEKELEYNSLISSAYLATTKYAKKMGMKFMFWNETENQFMLVNNIPNNLIN